MDRRAFIGAFACGLVISRSVAMAQRPGKIYRIGYLQTSSRQEQLHMVKAFEDGLRDLGYRAGENVVIEYRFAEAHTERLPELAADLVRLNVDVIVTGINSNTVAAMKATTTIPIVMVGVVDPVSTGLVASLARPGGNVTGLTVDAGGEIFAKRFEMLKEALPGVSRVGILFNPDVAATRTRLTAMMEIAPTLGLTTIPAEARGLDSLEQAFALMVRERVQACVMQGDSVLFNHRSQIAEMALKNRLPAVSTQRELAEAGFLLTYGADVGDLYRRAAAFVDKIFKGAKPADLPIEQPTKFELAINLRIAKALGLELSRSVLARADEVIE